MIYRFAEFELRPERYELLRSGEAVALEPRVLEVLAYLVAHRDRTVTKTELLDALWEEEFVTEAALTRTIRELRKALGDSASKPSFIKTVYGRGFLFVAEVEQVDAPAPGEADGGPVRPPPAAAPPRSGPFVGRAPEMARLVDGLEAARGGEGGRLVLIAGDPGIGKTRTCQELSGAAAARGVLALWGRSLEGLRAPPYWPWIQVVRAYLESAGPERLRSEMGAGAADIAEVVPELRERLPDLEPAPSLEDPDQARFRLFDSLARFLRAAADTRPLLLVLDNLHWADRPSLRLLEFLAQELWRCRILVVGTYREIEVSRQHPLSATLADLGREGLFERLPLAGFGRDEVAEYMAELAEAAPTSLVGAVHRQTEGNPFFVAEVVRLLAQEGLLAHEPDRRPPGGAPLALSIPEGVREVVGRRLNRLSEGCNAVLSVAAVIGRGFGVQELARVVEEPPPEQVAALLEEAEAARLIEAVAGSPGRYQFTHALVRETLMDELSAARRARLHRRIGESLEELHAANPDRWMPVLAHHFFAASPAGTAEKAVDYCVRAARQAAEVMADEEAAWLLSRALEAFEMVRPVDERRLCRLRLECGQALARAGQMGAALEMFQRAAAAARRLGSAEMLAEAALGMGAPDPGMPFGLHAEPALELLEEAHEALGEGGSAMRVRLLCGKAAACYILGRLEEGAALGNQALEMARRLDDPRSVLAALGATMAVVLDAADDETARAHLRRVDEMLHLAQQLGDSFSLINAHGYRTHMALSAGDVERFEQELASYDELEARLRQPVYACLRPMHGASLATLQGRFAEAERLIGAARDVGRRVRFPNIEGIYSSQMFTLRRLQGRLDEIAGAVDRLVGAVSAASIWGPGAAALFVELGRLDEARAELERQAAAGFDALPRDVMFHTSLCHFGEAACALGDAERARQLYELLLPLAGSAVARGGGSVCIGAAAYYLGDLAATAGLEAAAAEHFEAALRMNAAMGARPWLALARERFGRFLAATGGGTRRARQLVDEALATATELGMAGLERRAEATRSELA